MDPAPEIAMPSLLSQIRNSVSSVLFPRVCSACEAVLEDDGRDDAAARDFCADCYAELPLITGAACQHCGAPVSEVTPLRDRCVHCENHTMRFDAAVSVGVYDGLLRRQVLAAKHASGEAAAASLGRMMAEAASRRLGHERFDVVTSIPMHWRRRVVRQHNAAESMAQRVAERFPAPLVTRLLTWRRAAQKQAELAITPRSRNVRGALAVRSGYGLRDATILLVDDILTTGATCSEAARTLKRAGAARVVAVVAARSL